MTDYRIVKRAYSQYEQVAVFSGTYVEAVLAGMKLQSEKQDGEYMIRELNQPNDLPGNNPADQGGIAWV